MTSPDRDLKDFSAELNELSIRRQQLVERKKFQRIFQELKTRPEFGQTEDGASSQHDAGDKKLKELIESEAERQKQAENILNSKWEKNVEKGVIFTSCQATTPPDPVSCIFPIEPPPNVPAPSVILDVEKLPQSPCRTQCPECQQFIMTETITSANTLTWMMCFVTAMLGCVAGCCLIPFCLNKFKSTTHKCPRCRSTIVTLRRL